MKLNPTDLRIPITIGISVSKIIDEEKLAKLRPLVRDELDKMQEACPNTELVMLNSIASEAELYCAQLAIELGMKLVCPLPMPLKAYKWECEGRCFDDFAEVISLADESFVVKTYSRRWHEEPDREDYYLCAEKYVKSNSQVMLKIGEGVTVDYRVHRIEGIEGEELELLKKIDEINAELADEEGVVNILNTSEHGVMVYGLLQRIEDTGLLRKAVAGRYAYWMVRRIAAIEGKPEIDIAYENPKEIIPAIQAQADVFSDKLLEELYERKYGEPFDKAFEGLKAEDIEQFIIDLDNDTSLDEFEYIDARFENEHYEGLVKEYYRWRLRKLCEVDLI